MSELGVINTLQHSKQGSLDIIFHDSYTTFNLHVDVVLMCSRILNSYNVNNTVNVDDQCDISLALPFFQNYLDTRVTNDIKKMVYIPFMVCVLDV